MDEINQVVLTPYEILPLIIGGPLPDKWSVYCETIHDENLRNNRLPLVSDLIGKLAWSLLQVSRWKDDHSYTAKAEGKLRRMCGFVPGYRDDDGYCDRGERRG